MSVEEEEEEEKNNNDLRLISKYKNFPVGGSVSEKDIGAYFIYNKLNNTPHADSLLALKFIKKIYKP